MASLYLVSGELSGDSHGADLIRSLQQEHGNCHFHGLGGPEMHELAPQIRDWVDDAAVVGFSEVLKRYSWFKERFRETLAEIEKTVPDAVVFIDYPGFNLRLAKALREGGYEGKLIYYISPQVWAWNQKRIPRMARWLDRMLCLFPFERELFEEAGLKSDWVGHPLVEELSASDQPTAREKDLVGLFPGSREREVERLLPPMLAAAKRLLAAGNQLRFEVPLASAAFRERAMELREEAGLSEQEVELRAGGSRELMQRAWCGLVASGTATLEAAYFGMPYALIYRVAWPTYFLGRMLIRVKHIGMINILANEEVVHEFIQADVEACALAEELQHFVEDPSYHQQVSEKLLATAAKLGEPGASRRAAGVIAAELGLGG